MATQVEDDRAHGAPGATTFPGSEGGRVRLEWHSDWTPAVDAAFAAMPPDELMEPTFVKELWESGRGHRRQRIALLRNQEGEPVGVVPLKKHGRVGWQFLTQYLMPYARFFVRPGYTDAALALLRRSVDSPNVLFYAPPADQQTLRSEESWVVPLGCTYEELMRRTSYAREDRRCRKRAADLTLREDGFADLPEAIALWQQKWEAQGSPHTARHGDDMLAAFRILARQGRLKTFSLHDGDRFVAMIINFVGRNTLFFLATVHQEEYREKYPGYRVLLAAMEWACAQGLAEFDMLRTSGHYKHKWAAPEVRGYRIVLQPLGSPRLGRALTQAKDAFHRLREQLG